MYYQPEIETMPREQLAQLQLERMKESFANAYDNVELYQRRFDEAGVGPEDLQSLDDLTKFPFTVKQDLRDAYPFGMFARDNKDVARIHASSGTTGQATVVGHTAKRPQELGRLLRPRHRHGRAAMRTPPSRFPTATACSPAAWGPIPAARPWAAPSSPPRRATPSARCR